MLRRFSGKLGLGRLVAPSHIRERVTLDQDIVIEMDLSVPIFRYIYFHHDFDNSAEFKVMRQLLKHNMVCIDVGAHIGYFSLFAAKYSSEVIAFEPDPTTLEMFERNLELNPVLSSKIHLKKCALSFRSGVMKLYTPVSHPDLASLAPIDMPDVVIQQVKTQTLDEVISDEHDNIGFVKIDVEGAELDVLQGSTQVIEKHQPIITLELIEKHQQRFAQSCGTVVEFLESRDYLAYLIRETKPLLSALSLDDLSSTAVNNALFIPANKVDLIAGLI